LQTVHLLVNKR